jgi:hypothetical protein
MPLSNGRSEEKLKAAKSLDPLGKEFWYLISGVR